MKYNLLGQIGPEGQTNPAAPEGGPYIYDGPPGVGDNKGLTAKGTPVVEDTTTSSDDTSSDDTSSDDTSQDTTQETQDTKQYSSSYTVEQIMDYQSMLKNMGFDPGPIDGILGEQTRKAIRLALASNKPTVKNALNANGYALRVVFSDMRATTGNVFGSDLNSGQTSTAESTTENVTGQPDEYGFTPSQYEAGIPIYRKDAPAGGERVFSNADLKTQLGNGYSLTTVDITEGPDAGTSAADAGADKVTSQSGTSGTSTGFANSQIWEYNGQKYVVWQIPNTMMYMRYVATDSELDQLFSGRERPSTVTPPDTLWTSSVYFGNVYELSDSVITGGESPFFGFVDNFDKATKGRPWLVDDDEMFALWVEGYVEDRTIGEEEWAETSWFNNATKEEREWLILSKGRGIGDADFPADAQRKLEQDAIYYRNLMKSKGIANADTIKDANGVTFAEWFANQVTFGTFDVTTAADQINGLADSTSGITIDDKITNWLQGKGEVSQTRRGYASARNLALKWLGPVYGSLDDETLSRYAGIIRNAENPDVGAELLQEELKAQRKVLFSTDIYDENLTYEQIAAPWLNYSTRVLGERIDEKSEHWLNILLKNDQVEADKEITAYGLNNNIAKVLDDLSDEVATSVGVSDSGVQRGFST